MPAARTQDIAKARKLRAKGWPLQRIADELKAGKGQVSVWVRGISLPATGLLGKDGDLRTRTQILGDNARAGQRAWSAQCRKAREEHRENGRHKALQGEALHALACGLYWGEGSKCRNHTQITNSDLFILKTFLRFCRTYFSISAQDVILRVNAYTTNHSAEEIIKYWVSELELDGAHQTAHAFDVTKYVSKGRTGSKPGKLPYGTCTITIRKSTHIVQHIYGALEVYGGVTLDPSRQRNKPSLTPPQTPHPDQRN